MKKKLTLTTVGCAVFLFAVIFNGQPVNKTNADLNRTALQKSFAYSLEDGGQRACFSKISDCFFWGCYNVTACGSCDDVRGDEWENQGNC
jgi:hypothetical protein